MRDAICRECWLLICIAGTIVLRAMQAADVEPSASALQGLAASGHIAVLVQGPLMGAVSPN